MSELALGGGATARLIRPLPDWEDAPDAVGAHLALGTHLDGTTCGGVVWWWHPDRARVRWRLLALDPLSITAVGCDHPHCLKVGRIVAGRWVPGKIRQNGRFAPDDHGTLPEVRQASGLIAGSVAAA